MPKAIWNGAVLAESDRCDYPTAKHVAGYVGFWKGVKSSPEETRSAHDILIDQTTIVCNNPAPFTSERIKGGVECLYETT